MKTVGNELDRFANYTSIIQEILKLGEIADLKEIINNKFF